MTIDIDKLGEAELVALNHRIVERLRFLQQARAHVAMLQFRIGDKVAFDADTRGQVVGTITRYNKRTVSLVTDDGHRWNVAPGLLRPAPHTVEATVIVQPLPALPDAAVSA